MRYALTFIGLILLSSYKANDTVRSSTVSLLIKTGFRTGPVSPDSVSFCFEDIQDRTYGSPTLNSRFNVVISRLDTVNKIASGIFSGTAYRRINFSIPGTSSNADSINILEGRFDIRLR